MRRSKALRVLREVWASMPSVECKGLCWNNCSTVPVFPIELDVLQEHAGRDLPTTEIADVNRRAIALGELAKPCPFLVMKRCTAHDVRPVLCRAYGVAEGLPCPHGCIPTRALTDAEQYRLFERVERLT